MDSKYIKRLFGNNYHGFNYKEAERNVGVSYLEFMTRIQEVGGKPKLSEKISTEQIYWFTLFCYYTWFGYQIKVIKAPELCKFLRLYYGFTEIEEIVIKGRLADREGKEKKPKKRKDGTLRRVNSNPIVFNNQQRVNVINAFEELLRMPNNSLYILDRYMSDIDVNDAEVKIIKEFFTPRTIGRQIAIKLEKLYICLFPELYKGKGFTTGDLIPDHRRDIINILTAFDLTDYGDDPDLLKNHKHLLHDDIILPTYLYSKGKIYFHSGDKDDLPPIEYSKEKILEAIANSK